MTDSLYAERVRMALADAGYDPTAVHNTSGVVHADMSGPHAVPERAVWMALNLAADPADRDLMCWTCWDGEQPEDCRVRPLVEDCGRPR